MSTTILKLSTTKVIATPFVQDGIHFTCITKR